MAERVEIIIAAKNQFSKVFAGVQAQVRNFQQGARLNRLDQQAAQASRSMKTLGASSTATGRALSSLKTLILPLVGITLFTNAVRTIGQFQEKMSGVEAVTGATTEQMQQLTDTARELGATTRFSATEAAAGMEFLGRAGFRANQIVAAMPGVLNLAAAGQLGLAEAADIASNVLQGFGASADQADRAADILAATAAVSNTNVSQLGQAMSFVAPVSAQLGVSMEETAAAIGALSNAGVQGTRAGTSLRKVLATLAALTDKEKAQFEALGVSADRLNVESINPLTGKVNTLQDVLRALSEAGLSTAQNFKLFGDRGAIGATVLANAAKAADEDTTSLSSLNKATASSSGEADRLATVMSDNIPGAFRQAVSAFNEMILTVGDAGAAGALRNLLDGFTVFFRVLSGGQTSVDDLLSTAGQLGKAFRVVAQTLADVIGSLDFGPPLTQVNLFALALDGVAVGVASIKDGFSFITLIIARIAQGINTFLVAPIGVLVQQLGRAVSLFDKDLADAINTVGQAMIDSSQGPKIIADEIQGQFARGDTALARTLDRISGVNDEFAKTKEKVADAGNAAADATAKVEKELETLKANQSLQDLVGADASAQFTVFKNTVSAGVADLKRELDAGNISIQKFTADRLALQQELIDKEIALKQAEKDAATGSADQAKAAAAILVLQAKRTELSAQAGRDQAAAEEKLAATLRDVRTKLAALTGQPIPIGDVSAEVEAKFKTTIAKLEAEGNTAGVAIVKSLINAQVFQQNLDNLEAQFKGTLARVAAENRTGNQVLLDSTGGLLKGTKIEQQAIVDAHASRIAQINALEKQGVIDAQTASQARAQQDVKLNEARLANSRTFFSDLASLSQSGNDKVATIGKAAAIVQATIDGVLAVQKALASAPPPANFALAAAAGVAAAVNVAKIAGFAEGGHVKGPGTGTSDSIPARLSDGEFVMRASAVKRYGAGFFSALNSMVFPKVQSAPVVAPRVPKFAEGGLVDSGSAAPSAKSGDTNFRIVNVMDPNMVGDFLASSSGERAVLNILRRNSTGVKQVLR